MIVSIVSVYWSRQSFCTLCLKVFKLFVYLMGLGRLFHKEGPMHDEIFCPVLVLWKGCLSLAKLFLVSLLQCLVNSKHSKISEFHSNKQDSCYWKTWKYFIYALAISFFSSQPIYRSRLLKRYMLVFI